MQKCPHGATYGDAIIVGVGFAERDPWHFIAIGVIVLAVLIVAAYLITFLVSGPVLSKKRAYEDERSVARSTAPKGEASA